MKTPIHQKAELRAAAATAGGLTESELEAWSVHIAACPECNQLNAEELAMGILIQKALDPESPDPEFEHRILNRLRQTRVGSGNRWYEYLLFHPGLASAAACVLLVAIAGIASLTHGEKTALVNSTNPAGLRGLPTAVRDVIKNQSDGSAVTNIERKEEDGGVSYTVGTKTRDGRKSDFTVSDDGTLLSIDTTLAALPQAVRDAIVTEISDGRIDKIEQSFEEERPSYRVVTTAFDGHKRDFIFARDGSLMDVEMTLAEVAAPLRAAIEAQLGLGVLESIDKRFDDGETSYVAAITSRDGRHRDFTFSEDGSLSSVEVTLGELPEVVQAAMHAQVSGGRLGWIDKTFDDGEITYHAGTISPDGVRHVFTVSEKGKLLSREVAINETPEVIQQTIARVVGKGAVIEIDQLFAEPNHTAPFEIEGWKDGKPFYFRVSPTGEFLGMED